MAQTRQAVWQQTYRGIYPDDMLDHDDLEAFARRDRQRILDPRHRYYLFLDGGVCAGYVSFGPGNFGPYKNFSLCLNNLYIRKDYQGQGLGKRAFALLRQYCGSHGIEKFFCGCNAHNLPACSFYRHMGGRPGTMSCGHESKADDIIHFEFYLGV